MKVSLIQEALKRQREDMESPVKPPVMPPAAATTAAAEDHEASLKLKLPEDTEGSVDNAAIDPGAVDDQVVPVDSSRHRRKKPLIIAGVVVIVALVLAAVFILGGKILNLVSIGSKPNPPAITAPLATEAKPLALPPAVAPTSAVPAAAQQPPATNATIDQTTSNAMANPPVQPGVPAVSAKPAPPPPKEPVVWPVLTLKGLLKGARSAAAKINGAIVVVGDEIEGAKVIAITAETVSLQYRGETCVLRSGDSTK